MKGLGCLWFWMALSLRVAADVVTLKSGEVVRGAIRSQEGGVVKIEVPSEAQDAASIREIRKTEIAQIDLGSAGEARDADEKWHRAANCRTGECSYPLEYYREVLDTILFRAYEQCKDPDRAEQIAIRIREWDAERERVAQGDIKWKGQWYEGDAARQVRKEIQLRGTCDAVARHLAAGELLAAIDRCRVVLEDDTVTDPSAIEKVKQLLAAIWDRWELMLRDAEMKAMAQLNAARVGIPEREQRIRDAQHRLNLYYWRTVGTPFSSAPPYCWANPKPERRVGDLTEERNLQQTVSTCRDEIAKLQASIPQLEGLLQKLSVSREEMKMRRTALSPILSAAVARMRQTTAPTISDSAPAVPVRHQQSQP